MKIGILSDTHNQRARTRSAVEILTTQGAQALIHCGDFIVPEIVEICSVLPFWFVFGNNDSDMVPYLKEAAQQTGAHCLGWSGELECAGRRLAVAHGHMTRSIRELREAKPDYLFTGHSHLVHDYTEAGIRHINPGALHRADHYSVALLDLLSGECRILGIPV